MRGVAALAYSISCVLAHHLISLHYYNTCKASWFSFLGLDSSVYCGWVRRALQALQWTPLVVFAPYLREGHRFPRLDFPLDHDEG